MESLNAKYTELLLLARAATKDFMLTTYPNAVYVIKDVQFAQEVALAPNATIG